MDPTIQVPHPITALHLSDPTLCSCQIPQGLFDQGIHVSFLSQLGNALPDLKVSYPPFNHRGWLSVLLHLGVDVNFGLARIDLMSLKEKIQQKRGFRPSPTCFPVGHPSFRTENPVFPAPKTLTSCHRAIPCPETSLFS